MSVVEGLKIQIHVCGTYVLSVWFTLLIGFGSVWIFSRIMNVRTKGFCSMFGIASLRFRHVPTFSN